MKVLDIQNLIKNVVDEFSNNNSVTEKNIKFLLIKKNLNGKKLKLLGIENRLEQVLANLFDNAVSFSPKMVKFLSIFKAIKKIYY